MLSDSTGPQNRCRASVWTRIPKFIVDFILICVVLGIGGLIYEIVKIRF